MLCAVIVHVVNVKEQFFCFTTALARPTVCIKNFRFDILTVGSHSTYSVLTILTVRFFVVCRRTRFAIRR
jgi:hypothetical protein